MAQNNRLISTPVSPFQRTTHSAKFIKNQLNQQMKASLIAEAQAKAPDTELITTQLDALQMHAGDKQRRTAGISSNLSAYSEGFNKNPFYAFSKDGKKQISNINNILNDGINEQLVQAKTRDDAVLDAASKSEVDMAQIQINGNKIKVIDLASETGVSNWIPINAYNNNKERYKPLSIIEDYEYTATQGAEKSIGFSVSMSNYNDILAKANKIFDNVGKNKDTRFSTASGLLETITESDNKTQLAFAIAYFKDNGLTNSDINTLVSMELSENPDQTYQSAELNAIGSMANLATSKSYNETTRSRKKDPLASTNAGSGGSSGISGSGKLTAADHVVLNDAATSNFVFSGVTGSLNSTEGISGQLYATKAVEYGDIIFDGVTKTNEAGDKSRLVTDNKAMSKLISEGLSSGNIMMLNNKGELESIPNSGMFKNSTIYKTFESSPKKVMHLEDREGKWASIDTMEAMDTYLQKQRDNPNLPIPSELEPYFGPEETVNGIKKRATNYHPYLTAVIVVQTTDNDILDEKSKEMLSPDNVVVAGSNTPDYVTDEVYNYQIKYGTLDPTEDIPDDVAMPTIFVKMKDVDGFRQNLSGTVIAPKAQLEAKAASTRLYKQYIPTANFSTNSEMANQVDGNNFSTLSGTK